MRLSTATFLLAGLAAVAEACSLFIPFDEYPGSSSLPSDDGGGPDVLAADGGSDGDLGGDAVATCKGVDTKNDPANCGACGRRCVSGDGGCSVGRCAVETVLDGTGTLRALGIASTVDALADGGDLVYFSRTTGQLGRTLAGSGTADLSPSTTASGPLSVGTTAARGLVGTASSVVTFRETTFVAAAPALVADAVGLGPLFLHGNTAYWGDSAGLWWKDIGTLVKNGFDGGTAAPVAIDVYGTSLYWTTGDGTISRMDAVVQGSPTTVATAAAPGVESMVAGKKNIVLGQRSQGLLVFELDAAQRGTLVRTVALADPQALASDTLHVYAVDVGAGGNRGRLFRTAFDGTEAIVLADGFTGSTGLAVSGNFVYFADGARILRTTK
jgi:hypothetical protein